MVDDDDDDDAESCSLRCTKWLVLKRISRSVNCE